MSHDLDTLQRDALATLDGASDPAALEAWRIAFIGPKGRVKAAAGMVKDVPADQRPAFGQRLNAVKSALEAAFAERKQAIASGGGVATTSAEPVVDMTEPGLISSSAVGRRHILSRVREELVEVFARMGFAVAEGPELEDDEHNFVKLNIPADHPARDPADNFYVDKPGDAARAPRMLRSQTSTVQIRVMEETQPPVRIVSLGRVYRPDEIDATHYAMFHQIEGLMIDTDVTMADLKSVLHLFAKTYLGQDVEIRFRPSFFPFTEPSVEVDMRWNDTWLEFGGAGMVDPNVLRAVGYDPEVVTGFAFGLGVERLCMRRHGVNDIRHLYNNNVRFLSQF
jgi:phenylalanyl-tRNA synthetase alpha chain